MTVLLPQLFHQLHPPSDAGRYIYQRDMHPCQFVCEQLKMGDPPVLFSTSVVQVSSQPFLASDITLEPPPPPYHYLNNLYQLNTTNGCRCHFMPQLHCYVTLLTYVQPTTLRSDDSIRHCINTIRITPLVLYFHLSVADLVTCCNFQTTRNTHYAHMVICTQYQLRNASPGFYYTFPQHPLYKAACPRYTFDVSYFWI